MLSGVAELELVGEVYSAAAALELVRTVRIDIALVDMVFPASDGVEQRRPTVGTVHVAHCLRSAGARECVVITADKYFSRSSLQF